MTADRVRQMIYFPAMEEKLPLLIGLLRQFDARRTMVFVNTKRVAEKLEGYLKRQRLQCPGAVRRRAAEEAPALPARLPQRRARGADRHRRRLARPAHPRRQPRVQLRPAAGCRGLRAPHRPHRARRRRGRRDQLRLRGIRGVAAGHRGLHRAQDRGGRASRPSCWPRDLKPPVYKEWDPEDGPQPMRRQAAAAGRAAPWRSGGGGGGGRGGPRRSGGGGGGHAAAVSAAADS